MFERTSRAREYTFVYHVLSQLSKVIIDRPGNDEDNYLELSMGFPTSSTVGVHTRDCSTGDQIFPGMLPSEKLIKRTILKSFKARG